MRRARGTWSSRCSSVPGTDDGDAHRRFPAYAMGMSHQKLSRMTNEEVIEYLTQIKGVGRWTTEMLLMFALCREDVFALDDLGLQQAVIKLYDLKHRKKKIMLNRILKISEQWSPYRTYASMYLWRWKDNPPIATGKKNGKPK